LVGCAGPHDQAKLVEGLDLEPDDLAVRSAARLLLHSQVTSKGGHGPGTGGRIDHDHRPTWRRRNTWKWPSLVDRGPDVGGRRWPVGHGAVARLRPDRGLGLSGDLLEVNRL